MALASCVAWFISDPLPPPAPVEILSAPVWTGLYVLSGYFLGEVFIENFLIGMGIIFVIIFVYSIWKDPFGVMKQARESDEK